MVTIADFKDRRLSDSLYRFFSDANEQHRAEAARAFGSIEDTLAIDRLGRLLLRDPSGEVRKAAAFSLGQTFHPASADLLHKALSAEKLPDVLAAILKAYGKTTVAWALDARSLPGDSITSAGLAWSLYQAGIRGKVDLAANSLAVNLLDAHNSEDTRLGAAHFFARASANAKPAEPTLIRIATRDPSSDVRMAAVSALGKIASDSCLTALENVMKQEKDPRVVVNAVKALASFPYSRVKKLLFEAVTGQDVNTGIAASEVLIATIKDDDWIEASSLTNRIQNWRLRANVYEAALKAGQNPDLAKEIEGLYAKASNPYHQAAFLSCLKHYPPAFDFVVSELHHTDTAIVRSAAATALAAMSEQENVPTSLRRRFAEKFAELMRSDDAAVVGIIASALASAGASYKTLITNYDFLYDARKKLQLPRDAESLQAVEAAIAYFEDRTPTPVKNPFNHPVNWQAVKGISSEERAIIQTAHGNIVVHLLVDEAPGSVANFVALAEKGYFDNKFFHRIVPNFVVQAGCPRGDGWGSEDYSIRSEFSSRAYKTGSVGMASAGKDTECTQWFITFSPTPHLDGRYTIFGEVVEGLSAIDYLQVGDKILGVQIEHSTAH